MGKIMHFWFMTDDALELCIRRYNARTNKVIYKNGVMMCTPAEALVRIMTPLMNINLFICALYLRINAQLSCIILYIMHCYQYTVFGLVSPFIFGQNRSHIIGIKCRLWPCVDELLFNSHNYACTCEPTIQNLVQQYKKNAHRDHVIYYWRSLETELLVLCTIQALLQGHYYRVSQ